MSWMVLNERALPSFLGTTQNLISAGSHAALALGAAEGLRAAAFGSHRNRESRLAR